MDEFSQKLLVNVPQLSELDVDRIRVVAFAPEGTSLQEIAEDLFLSRDAINYSLYKLYSSDAVPGINNITEVRRWARGLIPDPFAGSPGVAGHNDGALHGSRGCLMGGASATTPADRLYTISDAANVAFLQALGASLAIWDHFPQDHRDRELLIETIDAFLDMAVQVAAESGHAVEQDVKRLRTLLEEAINQALEPGIAA